MARTRTKASCKDRGVVLRAERRLFFRAKRALLKNRLFGGFMRAFDTISVDSAGFSRSGLEGILEHIKRGLTVLVFPEGERCWDAKLNELKPGVTLLIRKSKATVVPLGLAGAFESWPRFRMLPRLAPPFLSWSRRRIAVSVRELLDGEPLGKRPRDEGMVILHSEL